MIVKQVRLSFCSMSSAFGLCSSLILFNFLEGLWPNHTLIKHKLQFYESNMSVDQSCISQEENDQLIKFLLWHRLYQMKLLLRFNNLFREEFSWFPSFTWKFSHYWRCTLCWDNLLLITFRRWFKTAKQGFIYKILSFSTKIG